MALQINSMSPPALLHHFSPPSMSPPPPLSFLSSSSSSSSSAYSRTSRRRRTAASALRTAHASSPPPPASASAPAPEAVDEFWKWFRDRAGASRPAAVNPGFVPEGLGLVAQRSLSRNEVVLEVPKKMWIDSDAVAASDVGRVCSGLGATWVPIALFLLREEGMGQASPWYPYLRILPKETNSPLFWSEEELYQIQGTQLLSTTLSVKEYVQSVFVKVEDEVILPNKHLFPSTITPLDFLSAFAIIRSRTFSGLRAENLALIPLADLTNHNSSITSDASWEIKAKGLFSRELIFSLQTPVSVTAGEQVYIQYDLQKSDAELALDYGFIEMRPDRQAYTLTLEIAESDPFHGDKLDIAEMNGLGETAYFDIVLGSSLPQFMLPYLRLLALGGTDAFLLESIFSNSIWDHLQLPVSHANEKRICDVVRNACKSALAAYITSIEEDEKLLSEGNLDPRLEIAVSVRVGEKKVLQQIDDIFRAREEELGELEYYQERRLKDLGLAGEQGEIIFWEPK
ncbi:putative fructose-bisphosphate aldolase-lysine N-methyltransferase, chloroplastic [Iris pallida]|uniref:Fructose-bisphosphate aldolase-lysine N-methyltransferase, chloroplastic n=1 Tax=Iris pallida TaxID=29817 RepID=A0AAX6GNS5_IRIPA|nr:putative fructose-bisphosphate aldolase-lysine N-methyltransferase, chloroplastic [Iris pallida]